MDTSAHFPERKQRYTDSSQDGDTQPALMPPPHDLVLKAPKHGAHPSLVSSFPTLNILWT